MPAKKTYTVNIESTITVYTSIEVEAKNESEAKKKAEDKFNDHVTVDYPGSSEEALELSGNNSFDIESVESSVD
jgi:hypothetical protein